MSTGTICGEKLKVKAKGIYGPLDNVLVIPCVEYEGHDAKHNGILQFQGDDLVSMNSETGIGIRHMAVQWENKLH